MSRLGRKGTNAEREAEAERWRAFQEAQAKKTAAELARRVHEKEKKLLQEAWSISMAVIEETTAVGDSDDDEQQVEARRFQRLMALKGRYLEIVTELRGMDYRAGRAGVIDIALPEALWSVPLLPVHDGLEDVLSAVPRRRTIKATARHRQDDGRAATDDERAELRRAIDASWAAYQARKLARAA